MLRIGCLPKPNVQNHASSRRQSWRSRYSLDFLPAEGRASGAKPVNRSYFTHVVTFGGFSNTFANQPFTKIQPDSTWRNATHLGTDYAAILVEPGFHPATKVTTLPAQGNGVVAIATSKGMPAAPIVSKGIHFSGYDWSVRNAASDRGGQPNSYDPSNVWTDKNGYLHLRMEEHDGLWTCAEVSSTRSLGYGSYIFLSFKMPRSFWPICCSGVVYK